ncbi:MAG: metallophosphoesterase [Gammaproteobacteria bacterium]
MSEFTPWFTWVHLSDLHAGQGGATSAAARKEVVTAVADDLQRLLVSGDISPVDVLTFTGDISQSAGALSSTEFDEAAAAVARVAEAAGSGVRVLFVPGNHDCRRSGKDRDVDRLLRALRKGDEFLDEVMQTSPDRRRLVERFSSFEKFVRRYPDHPRSDISAAPMSWRQSFDHDGGVITFYGVNSAWLADDDTDERKLQLGTAQLLAYDLIPSSVNVLMVHHPLEWLADQEEVERYVARRCHVMMSGHLHVPDVKFSRFPGGHKTIRIGAGATWKPSERRTDEGRIIWRPDGGHTYLICAIGMGEFGGAMRGYPRRWSEAQVGFVRHSDLCDGEELFFEEALDLPVTATSPRKGRAPAHLARSDLEAVGESAGQSVEEFGRARTAFPTDLSLAELHNQGLVVESRFRAYEVASLTADESVVRLDDIVARVETGHNVLILGRPGAGKSVTMYELARRLSTAHYVFPFRLSVLRRTYAQWRATQDAGAIAGD